MIESTESKAPPRPGITFPESFTLADRLKTDSIKSPTIEEKAIKMPITIIFTGEPTKISGQIYKARRPAKIEPTKPPEKPAKLLFGLDFIKPLLFFPKRTPKNHAKESQKKTIIKKTAINGVEASFPFFEKSVILETKVSIYPE